jgi:hypothetical protein
MDNLPETGRRVNGIIPPDAGEFAGYLIDVGEYDEAYALQQRQVLTGRRAALDAETYCQAWPVAMRRGYVEALQDLPF